MLILLWNKFVSLNSHTNPSIKYFLLDLPYYPNEEKISNASKQNPNLDDVEVLLKQGVFHNPANSGKLLSKNKIFGNCTYTFAVTTIYMLIQLLPYIKFIIQC